ncbi:MAG: circadian clock KaiB family protein [Sedimenticola sp.]
MIASGQLSELPASGVYKFRLFVAGDESNSRRARENLQRICDEHLTGHYQVEVIDVINDFNAALAAGVVIPPTLLLIGSDPLVTIFGDLSDEQSVLAALGLGRNSE